MTFPLPTPELERIAEDFMVRLELVTPADFTVASHRCRGDSIHPGGSRVGVCTTKLWMLMRSLPSSSAKCGRSQAIG